MKKKEDITEKYGKHLAETARKANAAGMSYGQYVAMTTHPVTVKIPEKLKNAPTYFDLLKKKGAKK